MIVELMAASVLLVTRLMPPPPSAATLSTDVLVSAFHHICLMQQSLFTANSLDMVDPCIMSIIFVGAESAPPSRPHVLSI